MQETKKDKVKPRRTEKGTREHLYGKQPGQPEVKATEPPKKRPNSAERHILAEDSEQAGEKTNAKTPLKTSPK